VYDDGLSPSKTALETNVRCVLGTVEFSYDETGPGRLTVRIPRVQAGGSPDKCRDRDVLGSSSSSSRSGNGSGSAASSAMGGMLEAAKSLLLRNKQPHFDAKTGGHVLDFGGRVTMPSVKNFQLQCNVRSAWRLWAYGDIGLTVYRVLESCRTTRRRCCSSVASRASRARSASATRTPSTWTSRSVASSDRSEEEHGEPNKSLLVSSASDQPAAGICHLPRDTRHQVHGQQVVR
jgi:hypothetical protein